MLEHSGSSLHSYRDPFDSSQCFKGYMPGNGRMCRPSSSRDCSQQHPSMCGREYNQPNHRKMKELGPWAKGLQNGMPDAATGPAAMCPVAKYPLVLAEDRTRRPDVLRHLRMYGGDWNITSKHYWALSSKRVMDFHRAGSPHIRAGALDTGRAETACKHVRALVCKEMYT
ncbi:uncharacterized protein LOC123426188 isoform X2 [Hordeum vulgare subsp. vulgare]|nr:uncharacterized protein LOC123426188 isoform X2 [Hordeum vulgare subsp. vulgare]